MFDQDSSQDAYQETPYNDESWEIVGEPPKPEEFIPMNIDVLQSTEVKTDPMFANYGGIDESGMDNRYHLPETAEYKPVYADNYDEGEIERAREAEFARRLEAAKAEAYAEGRTSAIEETVAQQNDKFQQIEEQFKAIFLDLSSQINEKLNGVEEQALDLSLLIAKKIVGSAVEINPEYILPILRQALSLSSAAIINTIRVSPQDYEFIELVGLKKDLQQEGDDWNFKADETIRAGCIVDTNTGEVDFDIDKAWDRIAEQVIGIVK